MQQRKDWIDIIVDKVHENYNGRQVVIWGFFETSCTISGKLKERYGISTAFYVDGNAAKTDNVQVFHPDCLDGKSDTCYVVIPLTFYQSIKEKISEYGYKEDIDYYYFCGCILRQEPDYFEDAHGNKIIGNYKGLKFAFFGFYSTIELGDNIQFQNTCLYFFSDDSRIKIGSNVELKENVIHIYNSSNMIVGSNTELKNNTIYIHNHSEALIGEGTKLKGNLFNIKNSAKTLLAESVHFENVQMVIRDNARLETKDGSLIKGLHISVYEHGEALLGQNTEVTGDVWEIRENARLHMGNGGKFIYSIGGKSSIHIAENAGMIIGNNFHILENYRFVVASGTNILIGDDCVMSYNITMYSSDLHSIFDVVTGENINSNDEIKKERKIVIGNHVWLGVHVTVLYNTQIGDGSVIGAMSLVKSKIPNNCIAAGSPARVVRRDIAWSMNDGAADISDCGEEYVNLTEESRKE